MEDHSQRGLVSKKAIGSLFDLLSINSPIDRADSCSGIDNRNVLNSCDATTRASPFTLGRSEDLFKTKNPMKRADNFKISNDKIGHLECRNNHRAIDADNSHFNYFILEDVKYIGGHANQAKWTFFNIKGTLINWEFKNTTFEDGHFSVIFENAKFKNVTFKNITWHGSNLNGASFKKCTGAPR